MKHRFAPLGAIAALIFLLQTGLALAETRVALVIGNSKYGSKPLKNPVNDARAMSEVLKKAGFDVELIPDASLNDMIAGARRFLAKAQKADVRLFYYAGHAAQVRGNNYLAPIDGRIVYEDELDDRGFNVSRDLVDRLNAKNKLNIVILDACRDNPYQVRTRSQSPGLAVLQGPPSGTLIAYSTSPGGVAEDTPDRPNSRYTHHLVEAIKVPGIKLKDVFERVAIAVQAETRERAQPQVPWYNTSATRAFCFTPAANDKCVESSAAPIDIANAKSDAKAKGSDGGTRSDESAFAEPGGNDPRSVSLLYEIEDEAKRLRADQLDALRRSAERGDSYAATLLGAWHENNGKPGDLLAGRSESIRWYRRAADKDYLPAMFMLAYAHEVGWASGVADLDTARKYYSAAEKRGYAPAQWGLARIVAAKQPQAAVALYKKSAEQGYVAAMADLALAHLKGLGTAPDAKVAEQWARAAYDKRQSEKAQHILGYLYWKKLINAKGETDELRLTSFAKLREPYGSFAFGVE
jgi:uncharacterized caspase-like protein